SLRMDMADQQGAPQEGGAGAGPAPDRPRFPRREGGYERREGGGGGGGYGGGFKKRRPFNGPREGS
ncbi:MAG TPA: hypothetical protein VK956_05565, partial [Verrucomicrobium sp.]|nr:hypothetical protein [Verrucomicrobium sp.]